MANDNNILNCKTSV